MLFFARLLAKYLSCIIHFFGPFCKRDFASSRQNTCPARRLARGAGIYLTDFYGVAADAEGETCAEADAAGEALGAGDGEGGAVVPGVSSERISPSCTVML